MIFTTDDLAALLLDIPGASAKKIRSKLHDQRGVEKNQTAKNIHYCISRLMKEIDTDNVLDLYKPNKSGRYAANAWISSSGFADTTKLRYYNALRAVANPNKKTAEIAKHIPLKGRKYFQKKADDLDKIVKAEADENMADERELNTILPWETIREAYRNKRSELTPVQSLIADIYIGYSDVPEGAPRRLDYDEVKIYKTEPLKPKTNALWVSPNEVVLYLTKFKTAATYGKIKAVLPEGLANAIRRSLDDSPREYLFCKERGIGCPPMTAITFGYHVKETTKALTGKSIPVSGLRKSFITWLHAQEDMSVARLKQFARQMGHSVETAMLYKKLNIRKSSESEDF